MKSEGGRREPWTGEAIVKQVRIQCVDRLVRGKDLKLARFQGKPGTLSPKARFFTFAGRIFPSKFRSAPYSVPCSSGSNDSWQFRTPLRPPRLDHPPSQRGRSPLRDRLLFLAR